MYSFVITCVVMGMALPGVSGPFPASRCVVCPCGCVWLCVPVCVFLYLISLSPSLCLSASVSLLAYCFLSPLVSALPPPLPTVLLSLKRLSTASEASRVNPVPPTGQLLSGEWPAWSCLFEPKERRKEGRRRSPGNVCPGKTGGKKENNLLGI